MYVHAKSSPMHVEDPVGQVRVWEIMEALK